MGFSANVTREFVRVRVNTRWGGYLFRSEISTRETPWSCATPNGFFRFSDHILERLGVSPRCCMRRWKRYEKLRVSPVATFRLDRNRNSLDGMSSDTHVTPNKNSGLLRDAI